MLRSLGVPCKLVVGYAGASKPAYHAWISVWTEKTGWIDNAIYFDSTGWHQDGSHFCLLRQEQQLDFEVHRRRQPL